MNFFPISSHFLTPIHAKWDTYRTLYPLMALHDAEDYARIVRGMINIQQNEGGPFSRSTIHIHHGLIQIAGWLPECRGSLDMQWIQGGSSLYTSNIRF